MDKILTEAKKYFDNVTSLVDKNGIMAIMSKRSVYYKIAKKLSADIKERLKKNV